MPVSASIGDLVDSEIFDDKGRFGVDSETCDDKGRFDEEVN